MSNLIQIKRSAVPGKTPATTDVQLGELAVNTTDGKLFIKQEVSGVQTVVEVGPVKSVAGKVGTVTLNSTDVGLANVENKSSSTIRSEITSANVLQALGYTPYNTTNPANYLTSNQSITFTGDASGSGNSNVNLTLASVNSSTGSFGTASSVAVVTANAKGLVTAVSSTPISIAESQVINGTLLARVADAETITGAWAFSNAVSGTTPTANAHLTTKSYVDTKVATISPTTPYAISGFDCPCDDTAFLFKDRSGNLKHLIPNTAHTTPFATAGYATSAAGTNQYNFIPASKFALDVFTDSFWLHFKINKALPASNEPVMGNGDATASANFGFYLSARTTGVLAPIFNVNGGTYTALSGYSTSQLGTVIDGNDHVMDLLYDKVTRGIYVFVDGVLKVSANNVVPVTASSASIHGFAVGATFQPVASSTQTSFSGKFANIVFEKYAGSGLPLNIRRMVSSMSKAPQQTAKSLATTIPPIMTASAYWLLGWCGQSNENGASDIPQENVNFGLPTRDSILPSGSLSVTAPVLGSMFPAMVEACANGGKHLINLNSAVGSASLSQYWCGLFVTWAASTTYSKGAYAIANGNVYKFTSSTNATSVVGNTAASAPTWPGTGTVVDGEITWTYVRAATGSDVVGTVLTFSNALFDPNGAFAALNTQMALWPASNLRKAMAISIGQGDKTVGDTLAIYQASLISATNYALSQGWEVFIGLTCDGATSGYTTWLTNVGQPARSAALTSFSANPLVHAGVDLYATLGPLAVKSYDLGLRPDQLHMNSIAANDAGTAWGNLLANTI